MPVATQAPTLTVLRTGARGGRSTPPSSSAPSTAMAPRTASAPGQTPSNMGSSSSGVPPRPCGCTLTAIACMLLFYIGTCTSEESCRTEIAPAAGPAACRRVCAGALCTARRWPRCAHTPTPAAAALRTASPCCRAAPTAPRTAAASSARCRGSRCAPASPPSSAAPVASSTRASRRSPGCRCATSRPLPQA